MSAWRRVAVPAALLLRLAAVVGCARLDASEGDGGAGRPLVEGVDPAPGAAAPDAHFRVRFSAAMDQGQLLSEPERSDAVVVAAQADVERAFAAISKPPVNKDERNLFIPAIARVSPDGRTVELVPRNPLPAGAWFLLVAPKLQDREGRRLQGNGARFGYEVASAPPAGMAKLLAPAAGSDAPLNLAFVHATAPAGRLSLVDDSGTTAAGPVDAHGAVQLPVGGVRAGARLRLALDGTPSESEAFTISRCARRTPVSIDVAVAVDDASADVRIALDGPAYIEVELGRGAEPCAAGCTSTAAVVSCPPVSACAAAAAACSATLHLAGLSPATDYAVRVTARDLPGFVSRGPAVPFSTLAALPRVLLSEVMASPPGPTPRSDGEYVEIVNLGPGAARVDDLALVGPDGTERPLLGMEPPLPIAMQPGDRALAVGSAFDPGRYPDLPRETPLLRASTQKLLGHGLPDDPPPPLRLVLRAAVRMELSRFPGGGRCPAGASAQRDESAPVEEDGTWTCGPPGGTPGLPP